MLLQNSLSSFGKTKESCLWGRQNQEKVEQIDTIQEPVKIVKTCKLYLKMINVNKTKLKEKHLNMNFKHIEFEDLTSLSFVGCESFEHTAVKATQF